MDQLAAYSYSYSYSYGTNAANAQGLSAFLGVYMIFMIAFAALMIVSMWKIFAKAGKEGWKSLIPIYNFVVMNEIVGLPEWYVVLAFVPFANIYYAFKLYIELAKSFGQSAGFGVAMVFFSYVCMPILAFSKNMNYVGPSAAGFAGAQPAGGANPYAQPVQPTANDPTQPKA